MGSHEFTGAVHLEERVRADAKATALERVTSVPAVWLGLCWGLCAPLLVTERFDGLIRAWGVSVPVCLAGFLLAAAAFARLLRRRGLSGPRAARRAAFVMTPAWIVGFSPLVLFLPARGLPVFLFFIASAVVGYRLVNELRARDVPVRPHVLETIILVALFLAGMFFLFQVHVVHDAFQYYGYLASVALDGDLDLYNQVYLQNAERFYNPFPLESGRYIGTAVLEAPFFALGHLVALGLHAAGHPVPPGGFSLPYGFGITLGSSLFGLAGLVLCYRLSRELFSRRSAMVAVLAVSFASPLVFFMFTWGGWAHPIAFCLVSAFLYYWHRTRGDRSPVQWAALGLLAGLIGWVRPTAAVVLVFPVLEWIVTLRQRERGGRLHRALIGPATALFVALVVFSPQLSIWKAISGSWISAPYREVGDFHDWLRPEFAGLLFSAAQHGLLAWTPLLLVAGLGIVALFRVDRLLALGSTLAVLGTVYVYACWSIWWTGIGFSNRFFIELTPMFVLGLGALLHRLKRRAVREWAVGLLAVVVLWNLFLVGAYRANDIPQGIPDPHRVVDDPLTFSGLAANALQVAPHADGPRWLDWGHDGYFTGRIARSLAFDDLGALIPLLAVLVFIGVLATLLVRLLLSERPTAGSRARPLWALALGLVVVVALHGAIWQAAGRTAPAGRFHHLPETGLVIGQPAADTWIYSDYHLPVTSVDLLTHLVYGHGVPQGAAVASVTVFDRAGRSFERMLRAGVDTAEASYPRPEYRDAIRHRIDHAEVVRARQNGAYSKRSWEALTFHAVVELPEPMVVQRIRLRYLRPDGRLVVSDVFLREW